MEAEIDYSAVVLQLQLENEALRRRLGLLADLLQAAHEVPNFLLSLWQKIMSDRRLLIILMVAYWLCSVGFLFYDRMRGKE